ncbi:MAG: hypothetical protein EOP01_01605 [Propionibacteriaceae bacterium]|nr:MAG: hypothetical protein EOP01_01605 [Propionibacteriaceae bacterium]
MKNWSDVLAADLQDWAEHLQAHSFTDHAVERLLYDVGRVVPSALGYTLRLLGEPWEPPVSITVADEALPPDRIRSTLTMALTSRHDGEVLATFYAGEPDAFDRIADRLAASLGLPREQVRTDSDVTVTVEPGIEGLADHTELHYAFGLLLGRGRDETQARAELARLAHRLGSPLAAARAVLQSR